MFRKVDRSPQPTHSQIACHAAPPSHADAARTRARRRGAARQLPPAFFFFPLGSSPLLFKAPSHSRSCRTRPAASLPPSRSQRPDLTARLSPPCCAATPWRAEGHRPAHRRRRLTNKVKVRTQETSPALYLSWTVGSIGLLVPWLLAFVQFEQESSSTRSSCGPAAASVRQFFQFALLIVYIELRYLICCITSCSRFHFPDPSLYCCWLLGIKY
jgi:hypothetical protein